MPGQHALVTASGADRWMHCTPSPRLESQFPDSSSEAAAEGTVAHSWCEKMLKHWISKGRRHNFKIEDVTMKECCEGYRDYVIEIFNQLKKDGQNPHLEVEVKLDLSSWIPKGFGTSDAVILSKDTLHIVDFKYGKNVKVEAPENPQMRLYALGALDLYGEIFEFDKVKTHIFQPRCDGGHISTEEISTEELLKWGESVKPLAQAAFEGAGKQTPGRWCMFCRAKAVCKARADEMFSAISETIPAELLSLEDIAGYLPKLDAAIRWAKDIQKYALDQALSGETVPGYKVVEGRSVRKVSDPDALAEKLMQDGYTTEDIWKPREIQTLTKLEKAVGKKQFDENYRNYLIKPKGKPTLVPESDKRKPYQMTAEEMFGEPTEGEN